MRLLYVCADPGIPVGSTRGASTHVAEMVRAFREEGHEVLVAARTTVAADGTVDLDPRSRAASALLRGPWGVLRGPVEDGRLRRRLAEQVAAFRPHLVYERHALWRSAGARAAQGAGIPHVLEVNAPLAAESARFRRRTAPAWLGRVEAGQWRRADLVVVPSSGLERRVRRAGQVHVLRVPNAVDLARFAVAHDADAVRRRLGLEGRFVVGFVGTPRPWHDLGTVVDAVAALPPNLRPALLVVGDSPLGRDTVRRARETGVVCAAPGGVPHEQVPEHLAAMDVCVASLLGDPDLDYFSPLKAMEYLAAGRPTVVADTADAHELVDAGAALPYVPEDAASLGAAIRRLAGDCDLRDRLCTRGEALAARRTWRAAVQAVVQALDEAPAPAPLGVAGTPS